MHRYVKNYEGNSLVTTIQLYFNSFKTENAESIVGGGIIGASLFYLCYYLLSEVGVILISILLFFLGIVFICKKTIKDFIKMMIAFFKRVYALLNKTGKKLRNKIDEYDLSYTKSKVKFKISKINNTEYYNREYEFAKRNVETIKKVLNSMNVFYNDITYIICRNITVYFISSHYHFSYEAFGRNLKNYIHNFQLKQDEVAGKVSKSRAAITNSLRLLKLDPRVQKMLEEEMISTGHARALLAITNKDQQYEIAQKVFDEKLSVRDIEKLVKDLKKIKKNKKEEKDVHDILYTQLEESMKQVLGSKVTIKNKKNNKGKIEIEYYSQDELERIVDMIRSI